MKKLTAAIFALVCALCCVFGIVACGEDKEVAVTGITLNKTELVLNLGDSETLIATITPKNATNKSITWTSDDPGFVRVQRGVVTGLSVGSATITATAGDKSATCVVTVKAVKMSSADWAACVAEFEKETNYTEAWYNEKTESDSAVFLIDGTTYYEWRVDGATNIYQKQDGTYVRYYRENDNAEWTKTTVDEQTYLDAVTDQNTRGDVVKALAENYEAMDYDGIKYTLASMNFDGIDVTDIEVYVEDGKITSVSFDSEYLGRVKIGNIGMTEIGVPNV